MKRFGKGFKEIFAILLVGSLVFLPVSGWAQKAEQKVSDDLAFYKGKTVIWIVATKAGGGYDAYARMISPFLQKYLPGSTVIVKNVPGAGHIIGTNELYESKPDGLTLGIFNPGLIFQQLSGNKSIRFDLGKLTYLANAISIPRVFIVSTKSPYKTFDEVVKNAGKVVTASAGVGSASHNDILMLNKIFGINMKIVAGFAGQEADLAMLRGEVTGQIGQSDQMDQLIENGQARGVLIIGGTSVDPKKYPQGKLLSDIAPKSGESLAHLMAAIAAVSRPLAAPPGLPEGRAMAMRDALWRAMNDPELQKMANQAKLYVKPISAEETAKMVKAAMVQPPDVIDLVKEMAREEK